MEHSDNDLSLKDLILKLHEYVLEIIRLWYILLLFMLISISALLYRHSKFKSTYESELKFAIEGQNNNSPELGFVMQSLGISTGRDGMNDAKIQEITKSYKLFRKLVSSKLDSNVILADKLIDIYSLDSIWSESNPHFKDFKFGSDTKDTLLNNIALKRLKHFFWDDENPLAELELNAESGIYSLKTHARTEELTLQISHVLYSEIKEFFEDEVYKNQIKTLNNLRSKRDSIDSVLRSKLLALARYQDRANNILLNEDNLQIANIQRQLSVLNKAYIQIYEQYETLNYRINDMRPMFLEIDVPFKPLNKTGASFIRNLFLGIVIGTVLGIIIIVIRKFFLDIMR